MMHSTDGSFCHIDVNADKVRIANLALTEKCKRFVVRRDEALVKSTSEKVRLARSRWQPKMQAG